MTLSEAQMKGVVHADDAAVVIETRRIRDRQGDQNGHLCKKFKSLRVNERWTCEHPRYFVVDIRADRVQ
jgi:hypothetical protein